MLTSQISSVLSSINACQRNWIDNSVPEEHLKLLIEVAQSTPTKQNVNFFKCIVFTDSAAKEELFEICHSEGYRPDRMPNMAPNSVKLLKENKEFIKREACAWIKKYKGENEALSDFVYEEHKCYRDIGYVIEAYIKDLKINSNKHTRAVVSKYFNEKGELQVRNQLEISTHRFIQRLITKFILKNIKIESLQNIEEQVIIPGITEESTDILEITDIILDVLDHGLGKMPVLKLGVEYTPRNQKNYNTQILAPVVFMWTSNQDETYNRLYKSEYDTEIEMARHQSLNVGISAGAVAIAAQLLGYKTGFCGCYNPTNISKWLSTEYQISDNNFPIAILGVGSPDSTKLSNLCVDTDGNQYLRNRRIKSRPIEILIE